jgi:hypothetical protein
LAARSNRCPRLEPGYKGHPTNLSTSFFKLFDNFDKLLYIKVYFHSCHWNLSCRCNFAPIHPGLSRPLPSHNLRRSNSCRSPAAAAFRRSSARERPPCLPASPSVQLPSSAGHSDSPGPPDIPATAALPPAQRFRHPRRWSAAQGHGSW